MQARRLPNAGDLAVVAMIVCQHPSLEALVRELRRNPVPVEQIVARAKTALAERIDALANA